MQSRYEVWRYSMSWNKWVRDIYRDSEEAQKRYEYLLKRGKRVAAPRPFNSGVPLTDRIGVAMSQLFKKSKYRSNRSQWLG